MPPYALRSGSRGLFCLQACRGIFLSLLIGEVTAGDAAAYGAEHRMAVTDKVARDSACRGAFQATRRVSLGRPACRQDSR